MTHATEFRFQWKCSYMGCDWWLATGPGFKDSGEEIERRTMLGDYELSIANGDQVRSDMRASMNTIRRYFGEPMPIGAVDAFNAHIGSERARTRKMCADRGIVLEDDDRLNRPVTPVTDRYDAVTIHLTHTGAAAGYTYCADPRDFEKPDNYAHANVAALKKPEYRGKICRICLQMWDDSMTATAL